MSVQQENEFTQRRIEKHNIEIERSIGEKYAQMYIYTRNALNALYANISSPPTLQEARKYARLDNLLRETEAAYKRLSGRTEKEAEKLSAYNYTEQFFGNMWIAENAEGSFKWKNPSVEAIRASVFWEGTGLSLPQRFGKNVAGELSDLEAAITRGLANGWGPRRTAQDVKEVITGGYNNALRVIRTETTRNRSEGSDASFQTIRDAGKDVRKIWIAVIVDDRTRETHRALNGVLSNKNGIFSTAWGDSIGPGDGPVEEVANCRCTTGMHFADEGEPATFQEIQASWVSWATGLGWSPSEGWAKAGQAIS